MERNSLEENISSPEEVIAILSLYIPQDCQVKDKLVWLKTPCGNFTTKSCYKLLSDNMATTSAISSFPWKKYWHSMKIQPKIHIFVWKVLHDGLAVYDNLQKFNNQVHNICPLCKADEETICHLLFNCQFAREVFHSIPIFINIQNDGNSMEIIQNWLLQPDRGIMLNLGACIILNIWKARNEYVFSDITISVQLCMSRALQDFKAFDLHHALNFCADININTSTNAIWERPPPLVVKVNVDAAFKDGKGAAAAVARVTYGNHIGSGCIFFNMSSSMSVEAKSYSFGLQLSLRLQVPKIIVDGNATTIPAVIKGSTDDIP
ncbi:uncharacterized protein LOC113280680 [Papaver somniferum]|uniref:uncharacterized protein LOC113280680 n=1 Tax=Papaver somniferum TaxID=3469 RepID=UPI000E6F7C62|nr:uncharacterized protein LOC113280680 [Papaver somniferum]